MPVCISLSPLDPSPLLTKPSSVRLRPPPPARSAGRRCSQWRAAGSPPGSPPRPAGCSAPAPSASSSSRSCRTARSPAPPDTSVYSGWWRGSAPRGSTRPCSSSSPSGRDWWLSWRENRRVATNYNNNNNNNKESRFGVRTEVSRSSWGLQENATVLWQRRTVRALYAARPLTPLFSHRAPIGQCTETARAHWPISPCGRAGKNEEIRLGCLEGIVNQLVTSFRCWDLFETGGLKFSKVGHTTSLEEKSKKHFFFYTFTFTFTTAHVSRRWLF